MTPARHHTEWLSLVETSGPFLSLPVLLRIFPQGLDLRDPARAAALRESYEDWLDRGKPLLHVHTAWIRHVLENLLEWPADYIAEGQSIPAGLEATQPHFGETLRPDLVLRRSLNGTTAGGDAETTPQLLVVTYPPGQGLEKPVAGKIWKASPATRMTELLHASGVPLGLVTNGEHWMLVYSPRGETSGFASWYADLWMQEPITLRAFHSLMHLRRFFGVAAPDTLSALFAESSKDQQEVTDQLGRQVRRAVEMLVQAFDQIDEDSGRSLLTGVPEKEIYDAALTVMMRLVFLFSAEERGLLLLGDPLYDQHYAVSTLRELLRERADQHGEEVLERRHDAWSRLLATFRTVHGGVQHESMRLPAYGGSLFDPDRYPFLEGREKDSRWRETPSHPLRVNNRVVLHLLEALQILRVKVPGGGPAEARRVSFRALDIEQIGHVYEGLLDHTGRRAGEITLGLSGKNEPEIPLSKLEELAGIDPHAAAAEPFPLEGGLMAAETYDPTPIPFPTRKVNYGDTPSAPAAPAALIEFLKDQTGRSANALESALGYGKPKARGKAKADAPSSSAIHDLPSSILDHSLLLACGQDPRLARRIRPFADLLRSDDFDRLVVIRTGSVFVTAGTDRRSSGTHYTPKSLTEPIVKHTLDPLVYIGPAEGLPESEWKLKTAKEILALKICDMAMGSGAFLVQVCRYLAERLCEAWEIAEREHAGSIIITPDGELSAGSSAERLLPSDPAERIAIARRYVADRCLYGVDINPMAVEMAKLSLWLITLQKDRPFTFLDHALKCGDSLLGVSSVAQIENFSLRAQSGEVLQESFATSNLFRYVDDASAKRGALEALPSNDHSQIEIKSRLHCEAEAAIAKVKAVADYLIAFELRGLDGNNYDEQRADEAEQAQILMQRDTDAGIETSNFKSELARAAREKLAGRRTFHWPVEFPEVFARGGFNSFVGNPPFMGGQKITGALGTDYRKYLVEALATGQRGSADLCEYFFLRAFSLLAESGQLGLVATNTISEGDTRDVGLDQIITMRGVIVRARPSVPWPGVASLEVAHIWLRRGEWRSKFLLNSKSVKSITAMLGEPKSVEGRPYRLLSNSGHAFQGTTVLGLGFTLGHEEADALIERDVKNRNVIDLYLNGDDLNSSPTHSASRRIINFKNWPLNAPEGIRDTNANYASDYPECLRIIEERVKPERQKNNDRRRREIWWQFTRPALDLYQAVEEAGHALVCCRHTKYLSHAFVHRRQVFDVALNVIAFRKNLGFETLHSSIYDSWVREYGSSLETRVRYTVSDCFDTFAFPCATPTLESCGLGYYEHRQALMQEHREGLTTIYNRFHDPADLSANIVRLRALHADLDRAVVAAYNWVDFDLDHDFHETKQGLRYTISEAARREVLDRLLALNHQRYAEELAAGLHEKKSKKSTAKKAATKRATKTAKGYEPPPDLFPPAQPDLFG
ncbi:MAG: hypothetical protein WEB53_11455 [Akkermansiaceae bacterium]